LRGVFQKHAVTHLKSNILARQKILVATATEKQHQGQQVAKIGISQSAAFLGERNFSPQEEIYMCLIALKGARHC